MTNPIYVAIDTGDIDRAYALARAVAGNAGGLKLARHPHIYHADLMDPMGVLEMICGSRCGGGAIHACGRTGHYLGQVYIF